MRAGHFNERDRMEDIDVDGRIILEWALKKDDEMTWNDLALERDKWRTLVNTVIILPVLYIAVNFLSS